VRSGTVSSRSLLSDSTLRSTSNGEHAGRWCNAHNTHRLKKLANLSASVKHAHPATFSRNFSFTMSKIESTCFTLAPSASKCGQR
jgi:hypothetical protein